MRSLFFKFFLSISILLVVTSGVLSYFLIQEEIARIHSDIDDYGTAIVKELARDSEYGVSINNRRVLEEMSGRLVSGRNIAYVILQNRAGETIAVSEGESGIPIPQSMRASIEASALAARDVTATRFKSDILGEPMTEFAYPVLSAGEKRSHEEVGFPPEETKYRKMIGVARVGVSMADIGATIDELVRTAQVATGGVILFGLFVTALLVGIITTPLRQLTFGMKRASAGELVNVKVKSRDEIGRLAAEFNIMVENLRKYRTELDGYRKALEHKVSEREREASELRTYSDNIIATMAEGMVVINNEDTIEIVNKALRSLSGFSEDDLVGKRLVPALFPGKDRENAIEAVETTRKQGILRDVDLNLNASDGKERPVNFNAAMLRDAHGKPLGMVVIFHDMTKEREVDRLKNEFLSTISHELRTPLTSIEGFVTLILAKKVGSVEPKQEEFLKIVQTQSAHLRSLILNLLDFSRFVSGKMTMNKSVVSVGDAISEVVAGMKLQIDAKKIELKVEIDDDIPKITADPEKIGMTFSNILGNALKFTGSGGRIDVLVKKRESDILVAVSDNGAGIESENLVKIFERFYQIDNSLTRKIGGAGIGLSVAKEVVGAHGGKIWAESEGLGKGTKISFTLPLG